MRNPILLAALSVGVLAACAPLPQPQTVDSSRLSSGGRQLFTWKDLVEADNTLSLKCLEKTTGAERQRNLESCFAVPMRAVAANTKFPLKSELETYLSGVKKEVDNQTLVNEAESDFQLKVAAHRDRFIVAIHRYLANTANMYDGQTISFITDKQVFRLKSPAMKKFTEANNINRVMGGYQTIMTNNARLALAQRTGGVVPSSFTDKLELDAGERTVLSINYNTYVHAFFTNDDLGRLNSLYGGEKGAILQNHEQQAYLSLIALQQDLLKRKMAKGLSAALQKVSEGAGEKDPAGLTPLGKIGNEGDR